MKSDEVFVSTNLMLVLTISKHCQDPHGGKMAPSTCSYKSFLCLAEHRTIMWRSESCTDTT